MSLGLIFVFFLKKLIMLSIVYGVCLRLFGLLFLFLGYLSAYNKACIGIWGELREMRVHVFFHFAIIPILLGIENKIIVLLDNNKWNWNFFPWKWLGKGDNSDSNRIGVDLVTCDFLGKSNDGLGNKNCRENDFLHSFFLVF